MAIGARIRQLRIDHGIRLETLALASHVSRSTLQDLEDGVTLNPHCSTVRKVADALGTTPSDLAGGYDQRLIEEGWWPPERVKTVLEAVERCTTTPLTPEESASELAVNLSLLKALLELRRVTGLDDPGLRPFPLQLNTPQEVHAYIIALESQLVRDRPAPIDPASTG